MRETETAQGGRGRKVRARGSEELRPHAENQGFGMVLPVAKMVTAIVSKIKETVVGDWLWGLTDQIPRLPSSVPSPRTYRASSLDFPFLICKLEADNPAHLHLLNRHSLSFLFWVLCWSLKWAGFPSGSGHGPAGRCSKLGVGGAMEGNQPEHPHHEFPPKCPELEASGVSKLGQEGKCAWGW